MEIKENDLSVVFKRRPIGDVINCGDFYYSVFEVMRTRTMSLYAEVLDNGKSMGTVQYHDFKLRLYCLEFNKFKSGKLVDKIELAVGLTHHSTQQAYRIVNDCKCDIYDLEPLLEYQGFPDLASFNRVKLDSTKKYIRKVRRDLSLSVTNGVVMIRREKDIMPKDIAIDEVATTK